ncbi:UDP-glycosyltransferase UGT5 isoform X1 [Hyalella azteca]|uniref:UDP-glycosyltransferase UGT5 isoform X1 n=1 Tax=Hyalella azteca TaxID=294128 RepID=A0A979FN90_HYAAZ|nr:UDP-glycosyltransferase UGT5 isoform X1 [Hyalella azteca]
MQSAALLLLLAASPCVGGRNDLYYNSSLPAPQQHFKFLFLLPTLEHSHTWAVAPLAVALARRGHEVSMLCEDPNIFDFPNVTCIYHNVKLQELKPLKYGEESNFITETLEALNMLDKIADQMFSSKSLQELYRRRKEFDLIVIEDFAMIVLHPFLKEMPYALYSTISLSQYQSAQLGNVLNPTYVVEGWSFNFPDFYSLFNRFKNIIWNTLMYLHFSLRLYCASKTVEAHISDSIPLAEIERNASVHFINTILALDGPMPLLPNQIPIGGIVLRPHSELPEEVANFLAGEEPVVYVSFGISTLTDGNISPKNKKILFSVFSDLPYKVIVKIAKQKSRKIDNVLYVDSVPQQTILAHPRVKAYVSHCGLGGTVEAIHNGVPMVGLPGLLDQVRTARLLENHGVAILLSWDTLTEHKLKSSILEVIHNPSYRRKMEAMSRVFRDQLVSPLDTAVYWTEYTARHKGAPHLQSPAKNMSYVQLFALDVLALILLGAFIVYFVVKKTFAALFQYTSKNQLIVKQKRL